MKGHESCECPGHGSILTVNLPNHVSVGCWLLFVLYVFGTPLWSHVANTAFGDSGDAYGFGICSFHPATHTPRPGHHEVGCTNGANLTHLLLLANREVACGPGQGFFGESICPFSPTGFSLSGFIATSFGTGAMAFFSVLPVMSMWQHQARARQAVGSHHDLHQASFITMLGFQLFCGLFLVFDAHILPNLHTAAVVLFNIFLLAYWCILILPSFKQCSNTQEGAKHGRTAFVLLVVAVGCVISIVLGSLSMAIYSMQPQPKTWTPWGFWLGEAVGLSLAFGADPISRLLGDLDDDEVAYTGVVSAKLIEHQEVATDKERYTVLLGRLPSVHDKTQHQQQLLEV